MEEFLKRKEGESEIEFIARAYREKSDNMTCKELANKINEVLNSDYAESTLRSSIAKYTNIGIDIGYEKAMKERTDIDENEVLKEIDDKILELKKEQIKTRDQRTQLNRLVREEARWENLKDEILTNVERINENYPIIHEYNEESYENTYKREGLLLLSDFHYGIEINNIINKYNPEIAKQRINYLIDKTIEYSKQNKINTLNVLLGGDLISGIIHNNLRLQNNEDIISQITNLSEILTQMFVILNRNIPNIKVYYTVGNHGRISPNKQEAIESENFEYLLPWYLSARLKDIETIQIIKSEFDEIVHMNILGYDVLGVHGQNDRLNTVVHDLTKITRIIPYMICYGHLHKDYRNEDDTIVVVNGSLSGIDEYALSKRYVSTPHQKLIVFEENVGEICTYKIGFNN